MATRVGIELSPAACRIVEVDGSLPWRRAQGDTRVRSFSVLPPSGPETTAKLRSLRRRQAAVVVWGGRSEHRQVMVTAGSYEAMRGEALAALAAAGLQTSGVWADIAPATPPGDLAARRPVVVSMASASEMSDALAPLRDAGIGLRTVTTPAVALASLARMRQAFAVPGAIESYVALEEQASCIALVRNGILLAARDLPWGFIDQDYTRSAPRARDDIAARLAEAIGDFVAAIGGAPRDIGQVCLCGGLVELRSMAAALMERLDVEVEPLDSLFGIDAARLPEPADEFRERGAEMRIAWAVAADWPPAINLLRARRRQVSKTWLARAAVLAGAAAGLGGSWWVVERSRWWPAPQPATRVASNAPARGPATARPVPAPLVANKRPIVTLPPGVNRAPTPPPVLVSKSPVVPQQVVVNKTPVVPPVVANKAPATSAPVVVNRSPAVTSSPTAANRTPVVAPPVAANKAPATSAPVAVNKSPVVTSSPTVANRTPVVPPPVAANKASAVASAPVVGNKSPAVTSSPTVANRTPVVTPSVAANKAPATSAPVAVNKSPVVTSSPAVVNRTPAVPPPVGANKAPVVTPPVSANGTRAATPVPSVVARTPAVAPPVAAIRPPVVTTAPEPVAPRASVTPAPVVSPPPVARSPVIDRTPVSSDRTPAPGRAEPATARARPAPPPEVALPFDAALGTILYSADRKLAIIDSRIVGVGDEVRGARIVEITAGAVLLRDAQGRLRRLTLGAGGR